MSGATGLIRLADCDDCRHRRPVNRCRTCQILTFILIQRKLRYQMKIFLIRDVCTLIFLQLPAYVPPPKGATWRFRDCGKIARVPVHRQSNPPLRAICGLEFISCDFPNQVMYCTEIATKMGRTGTWTCPRHSHRQTILIKRADDAK